MPKGKGLIRRMNGWYIGSLGKTVGVGIVPMRKKTCLYTVSRDGGTYEVLAIFSNEAASLEARELLDALANGHDA